MSDTSPDPRPVRCPRASRLDPLRAGLRILKQLYPDARCSLDFRNPFELYVATVLSAQCTDARVNQVTPRFFTRFPNAAALAAAPREEIEAIIRPTGFYHNKAKNLRAGAQRMVAAYGSQVPDQMDALLTIPGTGRKTANVILGNAFGIPGIAVDTHVQRVARRLGWTRESDPVKIERDLAQRIPQKEWTVSGHRLIYHGRAICQARRPKCEVCRLCPLCPTGRQAPGSARA